MDPNTAIFPPPLNLISMGARLRLIARRLPDPAGLRGFGLQGASVLPAPAGPVS